MRINAVPAERALQTDLDLTGLTISFNAAFYAKNCPPMNLDKHPPTVPSDWRQAMHIHTKVGARRLVMVLDPRWMATTTSFSTFGSGRGRFAGLAVVKEGRPDEPDVVATPLFIWVPRPSFDIFASLDRRRDP